MVEVVVVDDDKKLESGVGDGGWEDGDGGHCAVAEGKTIGTGDHLHLRLGLREMAVMRRRPLPTRKREITLDDLK